MLLYELLIKQCLTQFFNKIIVVLSKDENLKKRYKVIKTLRISLGLQTICCEGIRQTKIRGSTL